MAIMKRKPTEEPLSRRSEIEKMFDDMEEWPRRFFAPWFGMWPARRLLEHVMPAPTIDVVDKKDKIFVTAEIPGVNKEDIDISVTENSLTIKGEAKREKEVEEEDYYCCERSFGSFSRSVSLPAKIQTDKVDASMKNGVLEIELQKIEEERPKEIRVEVK
ncbi:MAG TPA: Hsp20/alpha crystallin family protein [Actinobacteria bacterium]|nr:Hsp20/alpha crystallin family protein [Actinomycetota bacterium]